MSRFVARRGALKIIQHTVFGIQQMNLADCQRLYLPGKFQRLLRLALNVSRAISVRQRDGPAAGSGTSGASCLPLKLMINWSIGVRPLDRIGHTVSR